MFAILNQNFLNHHLYQWHPNLNSKALSWVPGPYINFFFLNIFIWTSPRIAFKFNMPQNEVFFLLLNFPHFLLWANSDNIFPPVAQVRRLNVIFAVFLPFTIPVITQQVLSLIPPKYLISVSTPNDQLCYRLLKHSELSSYCYSYPFPDHSLCGYQRNPSKIQIWYCLFLAQCFSMSPHRSREKVKKFLLGHIRPLMIQTMSFSPVSLVTRVTIFQEYTPVTVNYFNVLWTFLPSGFCTYSFLCLEPSSLPSMSGLSFVLQGHPLWDVFVGPQGCSSQAFS